jgi:hypothetical protein
LIQILKGVRKIKTGGIKGRMLGRGEGIEVPTKKGHADENAPIF